MVHLGVYFSPLIDSASEYGSLVPQTMLVPQMMAKPCSALSPQTIFVPHTMLLPHTILLPHTMFVPHTMLLPHTMFVPFTRLTVLVEELYTAAGDAAVEPAATISKQLSAPQTSR